MIHQATADHLSQMLGNGEIDMVLTSPRPKLDEPTGWKPLANEQLGLAVPPDHRLATRRRVNLSGASDDLFVAFTPEAGLRQIADRLCRHAGFAPTVAFQSSDVATVRALVHAGFGVAILPSYNPPGRDTSPPMLTITDRGAGRPLGLAWLTRRRLPAMAEAFPDGSQRTTLGAVRPDRTVSEAKPNTGDLEDAGVRQGPELGAGSRPLSWRLQLGGFDLPKSQAPGRMGWRGFTRRRHHRRARRCRSAKPPKRLCSTTTSRQKLLSQRSCQCRPSVSSGHQIAVGRALLERRGRGETSPLL